MTWFDVAFTMFGGSVTLGSTFTAVWGADSLESQNQVGMVKCDMHDRPFFWAFAISFNTLLSRFVNSRGSAGSNSSRNLETPFLEWSALAAGRGYTRS